MDEGLVIICPARNGQFSCSASSSKIPCNSLLTAPAVTKTSLTQPLPPVQSPIRALILRLTRPCHARYIQRHAFPETSSHCFHCSIWPAGLPLFVSHYRAGNKEALHKSRHFRFWTTSKATILTIPPCTAFVPL
jgi:hypothetical protein